MAAPRRNRVDKELVRRGMARTCEHAVELISAGWVSSGGMPITKPATALGLDAPLRVDDDTQVRYVGRGGHKLAGALEVFTPQGLTVAGKHCLDAGACTGGFTQVLLNAGAAQVIAADVGRGLLAWSLQQDPRVIVKDRCNVRLLQPDQLPYHPQLVVADLSFISLPIVLPALQRCAVPEADFVLMVKPQFEVSKELVPRGGVVRDPHHRAAAVMAVAQAAWQAKESMERKLGTRAVVASPLPGAAGNVEYFLWLHADGFAPDDQQINAAVQQGPQ